MPGISIVLTSPRLAPGLLTWDGWQVLRSAGLVGCASKTEPQAVAVASAGIELTEVPGGDRDRWSWLSSTSGSVAWLASDDGDPGLLRLISDDLVHGSSETRVEIVHASYDVPGGRLIDLVRVMDRLRVDCPWDREQTHRSLVKYLIEEAYETVEAIENGDRDHLREELGDLLLQVMFHARIAEEDTDDRWSIDDVAGDIVEKLIRRHPHVFGDVEATDLETLRENWEIIKATEKQRSSVFEGIPLALPALTLADKVLSRLPADSADSSHLDRPGENFGAELLDVVRRARAEGVDPEQALRDVVRDLITPTGEVSRT